MGGREGSGWGSMCQVVRLEASAQIRHLEAARTCDFEPHK